MSEETTATLDAPAEQDAGGEQEEQQERTFTQAEVDDIVRKRAERLARQQYGGLKPEDVQSLQERAHEYDVLVAASRTDQERAVEDARKATADEVRREERDRLGAQLVGLSFRAFGRDVPDKVLDGFLQDVNYAKYLTEDGTVDVDAVKQRVGDLAVKPERPFPDLAQGRREEVRTTGLDAGRERYEARRRKT